MVHPESIHQEELVAMANPKRPAVKKGETAVVVESVKAASDVYAPVDGEVVAANDAVIADPALVNSAATGDGWLWKMKLADEGQLTGLMDEAGYKALVG